MAYLIWGLIVVVAILATILAGFFLAGPREEAMAPPRPNEIKAMNRRLKRQGLDPRKAWKYGEK